MAPPEKLKTLVDRFHRNRDAYRTVDYNETQVRREFIDPLFKLLGWDVDNEQGYAEAYKDVVHEDAIKIGGATKAPDYSFRIGGARKFFVEAKKPSVDIKHDIHPAYQLRRYAWSAKLPLSILTDFEEFSVYDCNNRPVKNDKASTGRIKYIRYDEYVDRWDEITEIFSRDAILKGAFDRYADSTKKKRGTAEVDDAFLQDIEGWRDLLARNIALRNENLSQRELNFAVQRTIDRIIFLRICEDRGVEDYGQLRGLLNGSHIYGRLLNLYYRADEKYNSGLFHFETESGREDTPDELTPTLEIDDKALKEIIGNLYYPDSPYEFSVLPADILGQVYEQFLGKVIRLTAGHRAKVEEKPEVRKAGGVHYTPTYIVDYIVEQTVGQLLENSTPKKASELRILDPACGSGSFLIGAYQYLLDWHRDWYTGHGTEKHTDVLYQGQAGDWRLTTAEKKRILLNNIYGVDIDAQAVEVTKLSLLLKVLEGENEETLHQQMRFFHERALPSLDENIKCGNSLIAPDYYDGEQLGLLDEEELYRINVFDWEDEFAGIMDHGGFDAVIGNPPWVDIKGMDSEQVEYFFEKFSTTQNRMNIYATFLHKSCDLLKNDGSLGFITPTSFYTQSSYQRLREYLVEHLNIDGIIRMPDDIFKNVTAESVITIFTKEKKLTKCEAGIYSADKDLNRINFDEADQVKIVNPKQWSKSKNSIFNIYVSENEYSLLEKIQEATKPLIEICDFSLGLTPYDKYKGHTQDQIKNKIFHADSKRDETFKPLLKGSDITRYQVDWNGEKWISYGDWLGAPREQRFFTEPRILVRQIISSKAMRIYAGYTEEELYNTQIAFNLLLQTDEISPKYLLCILNSKLMTFYHRNKYLDQSKTTFQKILIQDAKEFPIKVDENLLTDFEQLADRMLTLHARLRDAVTEQERTVLERRITATDREIDQVVYVLYDLTEDEVGIVEKSVN